MNGYVDELESLLDDMDFGEFEEAAPRRSPRAQVRTPSRQSSFQPRQTTTPASQTQVQAAARNLDSKIETLTGAVKALETRANSMAAEQDKTTSALGKEITARKKGSDAIRGDLQQTKMLSVMLPLLTQETVPATGAQGQQLQVVTQSQNQFASILPFLLLMGGMGGSSGDSSKGPLGDQSSMLMLLLLLSRK
jgi:predicted RNase H-like nuclease (RuvC/YqgF family)